MLKASLLFILASLHACLAQAALTDFERVDWLTQTTATWGASTVFVAQRAAWCTKLSLDSLVEGGELHYHHSRTVFSVSFVLLLSLLCPFVSMWLYWRRSEHFDRNVGKTNLFHTLELENPTPPAEKLSLHVTRLIDSLYTDYTQMLCTHVYTVCVCEQSFYNIQIWCGIGCKQPVLRKQCHHVHIYVHYL